MECKTAVRKVFVDYIIALLQSGEEISIDWDETELMRKPGGFTAEHKGVCFNHNHADGRLKELAGMKVTKLGYFTEEENWEGDIISEITSMVFEDTSNTTPDGTVHRLEIAEIRISQDMCEFTG